MASSYTGRPFSPSGGVGGGPMPGGAHAMDVGPRCWQSQPAPRRRSSVVPWSSASVDGRYAKASLSAGVVGEEHAPTATVRKNKGPRAMRESDIDIYNLLRSAWNR